MTTPCWDAPQQRVIAWLMAGDASIRWQVLRDLLGAPSQIWLAEQDRVAHEGWGAQLLSHQDVDGRWTRRLYGKKWISTTYSMVLLKTLGLGRNDHRAHRACRLFLDEGLELDGGINLSVTLGRSETCITGMVLALLSWFDVRDPRTDQLVQYLEHEQMPDGGWNCLRSGGATHGSLHTTISVLEGLREHDVAVGGAGEAVARAEEAGREFMSAHRLYRSHRTGDVVDPRMTRLSFPPRWRHDILRGLDYFRSADAPRDERLGDPVGVLKDKQLADGRWPLQHRHPGATWFEMERVGEPSRWNTLRALRVLRWWEGNAKGVGTHASSL